MTFDNLIALHEMLWEDTNLDQQRAKFKEEEKEYKEAGANTEDGLYEVADMVIVSAGIARFDYTEGIGWLANTLCCNEYPLDDIWQAVETKMRKNMKRDWAKKDDVGYHHTEEGE